MCGRFTQTKTREEVLDQLGSIELPQLFHRRYNVAPTQRVAVIRQHTPNQAEECIWGFKRAGSATPVINARCESLAERPMFKHLLAANRCLIPADGFYEWKQKQPYYFQSEDQAIFAFAGLWTEGQCVIITRAADRNMMGIHDRMPVILHPDQWNHWLMVPEKGKTRNTIVTLKIPDAAVTLSCRPVSRKVNRVAYDNPSCLNPGKIQGELF